MILRTLVSCILALTISSARSASMNDMDHGPFVSWTIRNGNSVTYKGIAIKVGSDDSATVCFDTDLMRLSAAWTGGFLEWYPQRDGLERLPSVQGDVQFSTASGPGWSASGTFKDPRALPYGPLPDSWAHYRGLYVSGDKTVLAYTVADCEVIELPGFESLDETSFFTRTFRLNSSTRELTLRVCSLPPSDGKRFVRSYRSNQDSVGIGQVLANASARSIGFQGLPDKGQWIILEDHLCLKLPPFQSPIQTKLWIGPETKETDATAQSAERLLAALTNAPAIPDLTELCRPGPARWMPALTTKGIMGEESGPLAVDRLTVPEKNPWNSWIRCTGVDFLSDGRALVASVSGDVWLISGISQQFGDLTWKRFATGLYQPLGVKIVNDAIFVLGRDQVTRLHDLNDDGEADFYENFNNDSMVAENFHEYTMNLETDSKGDFYYTKGAPWPPNVETPHAGVLFKLSKDGRELTRFATGLRGPNGLAIGPNDEMVFSDNEGHWVPTCCVHWVKKGAFYGMKPTAHQGVTPEQFEDPLCWIPHGIDNSPGSPIWIPKDRWGPLGGQLLLTSYGKSTLSLVLRESVRGKIQGGVVRLPLRFDSGLIRGRFSPIDGGLYVCGLRVWQSTGIRYGALHRLRYTGKPFYLPIDLRAKQDGISITFDTPLDPELSSDSQDYSVERWNYRWIERYGSPHYSVDQPDREGHDSLTIQAVRLSADKKTVFLEIPDMRPAMQMKIAFNIAAADGTPVRHEIYNTINRID